MSNITTSPEMKCRFCGSSTPPLDPPSGMLRHLSEFVHMNCVNAVKNAIKNERKRVLDLNKETKPSDDISDDQDHYF